MPTRNRLALMGRIGRHYEREAESWLHAILVLVLVIALLTVGLAVMAVGALIWVVGAAVEGATQGSHPGVKNAGEAIFKLPGQLFGEWAQTQEPKPKRRAPMAKLAVPATIYNVNCPKCGVLLKAPASSDIGCPSCGFRMTVQPQV
jgi:DNA-directed RNA polymerase subunit RPC12/RpoP